MEMRDHPLSELELSAWVESLGLSDSERATRIRELLRYANRDEMTAYDRQVCKEQLGKLESKLALRRIK